MKLYHYWRSSSSWRVRWALALKKVPCEFFAIDLLADTPSDHLLRHPLGYVPVLEYDDGRYLAESMAILEWLEETHPSPSLFWGDPWNRAQARALAEIIVSDTQPLQNLDPQLHHSDDPKERLLWAQHWTRRGLAAFQAVASCTHGVFSVGNQLTVADLCLVPQVYNAHRQEIDVEREFPLVHAISKAALATESGLASHPDRFAPKPL